MTRELLWNGERISYRIETGAESTTVVVGEETHDLSVQELTAGRLILRNAAGQRTARAVRNRDRIWVWVDGFTFEFHIPSADESADGQHGDIGDEVRAPMPGVLVKLFVSVGDDVEQNQVVAVVEAMKMEHPLRAPRDGKVESITGAVGDTVDAGAAIVSLAKAT
ncbi:MAG: acetyl-CoA carboxylase biotin carboxyl carrier protein subunit [Calditrichota bacterium]